MYLKQRELREKSQIKQFSNQSLCCICKLSAYFTICSCYIYIIVCVVEKVVQLSLPRLRGIEVRFCPRRKEGRGFLSFPLRVSPLVARVERNPRIPRDKKLGGRQQCTDDLDSLRFCVSTPPCNHATFQEDNSAPLT